MAFFALDSQPGAMTADLYEPPAVIGVADGRLDSLEARLNIKMLECRAAGRVLAVSEIRVCVAGDSRSWYSATIVWCKKRQIDTGIPTDDPDEFDASEYEPDRPPRQRFDVDGLLVDDEPPSDYGSHAGAVIREYDDENTVTAAGRDGW